MSSQGEQRSKPLWFILVLALSVPLGTLLGGGIFAWGIITNRVNVNAQDIEKNGAALSTIPSTFIPRGEVNALLETLDFKISTVQAQVLANSEQSERQTAEIIRRIERMDTSGYP